MTDELQQIKHILDAHRRAIEELETTFLELEAALDRQKPMPTGGQLNAAQGSELLSVAQVCQELAMGKSWVHQRIKSGEIPSIRLGRAIKVKRQDLQEYLENHRHPDSGLARDLAR